MSGRSLPWESGGSSSSSSASSAAAAKSKRRLSRQSSRSRVKDRDRDPSPTGSVSSVASSASSVMSTASRRSTTSAAASKRASLGGARRKVKRKKSPAAARKRKASSGAGLASSSSSSSSVSLSSTAAAAASAAGPSTAAASASSENLNVANNGDDVTVSPSASPSLSDNIMVHVRVRPGENGDHSTHEWHLEPRAIFETDGQGNVVGRGGYSFENVFPPPTTNNQIYTSVAKPIVSQVLEGFNGTVFAYGQTGSGKTHTVMGYGNERGLVPQAIDHIFAGIERRPDTMFLLRVSFLEIYNEDIYDLLSPSQARRKLLIRETRNGFEITDLQEEIVTSPDQVMAILERGSNNRRVGINNMHEHSSRSHSVFRLILESSLKVADQDDDAKQQPNTATLRKKSNKKSLMGAVKVSELNLVDLAGSETLSHEFGAAQQKETKHINLSLSQLKTVITALSKAEKFVPYRNSTLTKILRNSLGGNAKTAVICTMSPLPKHVRMSKNTLLFGSLAKKIKNIPKINEVLGDDERVMLKQYRKKIDKLEQQLSGFKELEAQKVKLQEDYQRMVEQVALLKQREAERSKLKGEMQEQMSKFVVNRSGAEAEAEARAAAAANGPRNNELSDEDMEKLNKQVMQLQWQNRRLERELQNQVVAKMKAEKLIKQKQEALALEQAKAKERELRLDELEQQKREVERVERAHLRRYEELQEEIKTTGEDKDSYLARLIQQHETEMYKLRQRHGNELSLREAEKLELAQKLIKMKRYSVELESKLQDRAVKDESEVLTRLRQQLSEIKFNMVRQETMYKNRIAALEIKLQKAGIREGANH